ncbi:MAG: hypothetical protein KUG71_07285 [Porticoccaceae bacterium]|nr:hypothetical protein [Porticoccaceae bacterium]
MILWSALILTSCATHVEVSGTFPTPLNKQLPISSVVVFDQAFSSYRFENTDGREVSIAVGQTQVDLFTAITKSVFESATFTNTMPTAADTDLILVPRVEEVQISMPYQTKLNVFEVWIKYNLQVFDHNGEAVADWIMSAYGKTPTKFLKSDSKALNQAAIVALRDAGAHFIIAFDRVPEIRQWLDNKNGQARLSTDTLSQSKPSQARPPENKTPSDKPEATTL